MSTISTINADLTAQSFSASNYGFGGRVLDLITPTLDPSTPIIPIDPGTVAPIDPPPQFIVYYPSPSINQRVGFEISSSTSVSYVFSSGLPSYWPSSGVDINYTLLGNDLADGNNLNLAAIVNQIEFRVQNYYVTDVSSDYRTSEWILKNSNFKLGDFVGVLETVDKNDDSVFFRKMMADDDTIVINAHPTISIANTAEVPIFQVDSGPSLVNVDGGDGIDTVVYNDAMYNFIVRETLTGININYDKQFDMTLLGVIAPQPTYQTFHYENTLINVEQVKFNDVTLIFDKTTLLDKDIYLLYDAIFDRMPDNFGFRWWSDFSAKQGLQAADIAKCFMQSAEFVSKYGSAVTDRSSGQSYH